MSKSFKKRIRKTLVQLMNNETLEIGGYRIHPKDCDGVIWVADPYAIDCGYFPELSLQSCERILNLCNSKPWHDIYFGIDA